VGYTPGADGTGECTPTPLCFYLPALHPVPALLCEVPSQAFLRSFQQQRQQKQAACAWPRVKHHLCVICAGRMLHLALLSQSRPVAPSVQHGVVCAGACVGALVSMVQLTQQLCTLGWPESMPGFRCRLLPSVYACASVRQHPSHKHNPHKHGHGTQRHFNN